jgi:hypothetical protein
VIVTIAAIITIAIKKLPVTVTIAVRSFPYHIFLRTYDARELEKSLYGSKVYMAAINERLLLEAWFLNILEIFRRRRQRVLTSPIPNKIPKKFHGIFEIQKSRTRF